MPVKMYLFESLPVYSFALMIALSTSAGLFWVSKRQVLAGNSLNAGLWILAGAFIGSRADNILTHWGYYHKQPWQILEIWQGGYGWFGAVLGAGAALLLLAKSGQLAQALLLENSLPLLIVLNSGSWIAAWLNGTAYGIAGWGIPAWNEWGTLSQRFPVALLGALLPVLFYAGLKALAKYNRFFKPVFYPWFLSWTAMLFLLTYLRGDYAPLWLGWRRDAWEAFILCLTGSILWFYSAKKQSRPENLFEERDLSLSSELSEKTNYEN